uniref:Uncharacterized protein n=1 Tax=viral metagenome TaxID=1070528 RepID=A0A6C0KV96_9ZZZZ
MVMTRIFSTRLLKDPQVVGLEDVLIRGKSSETGLWRREKVREILDKDINLIKLNCVQCIINSIVELETSDIKISEQAPASVVERIQMEKAKKAYNFFKLMKNPRGTTFISTAKAMLGNACIRAQGVEMISIINQLKLIINSNPADSIPELDLADMSVNNIPPVYFRRCFYSLLTLSQRHTRNLTTLFNLGILEDKSLAMNANNTDFSNANNTNFSKIANVQNTNNSNQLNKVGISSPGPKNLFRSNSSGGVRGKTRKTTNTNRKRTKSQKRL